MTPPNAIWIDGLDLSRVVQRRQTPRAGRSLAGGRGRGAAGQVVTDRFTTRVPAHGAVLVKVGR
jgi:hypothetical protein